MSFLTLQENRCINTNQVTDLTYSRASQLPGEREEQSCHTAGEPEPLAVLKISLSSGEVVSIEGPDADYLWDAFQTVLQEPTRQPDWFLQILINLTNIGLTIPLTLQVSGFLVSGELCSGREYFDGMTAQFVSGMRKGSDEIKQSFQTVRDQYYPEQSEATTTNRPRPVFVHLKNARFFNTSGNPIPANVGVWWRGHLSDVGGFTLGSLSTST